MDKKKVIAEVIKLANDFENNGMVSIANKVTDIALKLAYDFNNPKKEEIVDESLALEDEGITHWNDDEDSDDSDDSDKIDFSNIFKELLVDDSLTKDFAFDDDEEDMDDSDDSDDSIDSDDYIDNLKPYNFDVIFIDGMHHCENVIRDFNNSINVLKENGTIFIDDCIPLNYNEQLKIPIRHYYENGILKYGEEWTGDVWKFLYHLLKN